MLEKIKILTSELLKNLWVEVEKIDVIEQKAWNYNIKIKTPESGLLIWQKWKNLENLSNIIRLMSKKTNRWKSKSFFRG